MKPTPVTSSDHIEGPDDARVTLVEYGDFECPYCVRAFPVIESARLARKGSLRFVFRHVSRSSNGFAKQAAEASEFAASEGRFWEMHRELFTHPGEHELEQLVGYAKAIGCDAERCRTALVERRFAATVRELDSVAARSGIIGTPVLFINGERFEDRIEEAPLLAAVDHAYARS
ncbi:MAG TPA: thioredoxin domain-containing protein [Polyangiaceae bacterium]|nr:thioredoxin domain-containing protein [Polyangiaceae bacterium]